MNQAVRLRQLKRRISEINDELNVALRQLEAVEIDLAEEVRRAEEKRSAGPEEFPEDDGAAE